MSQWDDNYKNHAIHTTYQNLLILLDDEELISEDIDVISILDRVRQAALYTRSCLDNVIPAIVNHGALNNANSYLQAIINGVNAFKTNKNIEHLNNTANHIDNLIAQFAAFPIPRPTVESGTFSNAILAFKEQAEAIIVSLSQQKDQIQGQLNEVSNASSDVGQQFGHLLNKVEQQNELINKTIDDFREQFESYESESSEKLLTKLDENKEQIDIVQSELIEQHDALSLKHKEDAEKVINTLEQKKKEASDLVQIIGNVGITGNYQNIANQEQQTADRWRNIALILMLAMVGAIALTIFVSVENGFDWKLALFRLMATMVLAIPAAYAAKESSKHRALENFNRKAELELASLDPFLEKLPEEKRHQIKESLTDKFFGLDAHKTSADEPVTYNSLIELIKLAIKGK